MQGYTRKSPIWVFAFFLVTTPILAQKTVVLFLIDGLAPATARLAADNGAVNLKRMFDSGVVAQTSYTSYPKDGLALEDGSLPWGNTSGGNLSVHTGCHMYESKGMDDIFLAARDGGIKSVYAGGSVNYSVITTPDFHYSGELTDEFVVQKGIDHFQKDKTRLIRLHPQRIRDGWSGPAAALIPTSAYIKAIVAADIQLGRLIQALKDGGVWDSTFLMVAADHGMGLGSASLHNADELPSWKPFISFYGPKVKKGATIPYAELPDLAIMVTRMLGIRELKGTTDTKVTFTPKGPTGTFLSNIFIGAPETINHPRMIERYLTSVNMKPKADYLSYRNSILPLLKEFSTSKREAGKDRMIENTFMVRSTSGKGDLNIEANFRFDQVDILSLEGKTILSLKHEPTYRLALPPISLHGKMVLVRLVCKGRISVQWFTPVEI
jgi:hypothetical protein